MGSRSSQRSCVRPGKKFCLHSTAENWQWRRWTYCLRQTVPDAAAAGKARSPMVARTVRGATSADVVDETSDCNTSLDTDPRMLRSCRRAAKHFEHVQVTEFLIAFCSITFQKFRCIFLLCYEGSSLHSHKLLLTRPILLAASTFVVVEDIFAFLYRW